MEFSSLVSHPGPRLRIPQPASHENSDLISWYTTSLPSLKSDDLNRHPQITLECCGYGFQNIPDLLEHFKVCKNKPRPCEAVLRSAGALSSIEQEETHKHLPESTDIASLGEERSDVADHVGQHGPAEAEKRGLYPANLRGEDLLQAIRDRSITQTAHLASQTSVLENAPDSAGRPHCHAESPTSEDEPHEAPLLSALNAPTSYAEVDLCSPTDSIQRDLSDPFWNHHSGSEGQNIAPAYVLDRLESDEQITTFPQPHVALCIPSQQVWCNEVTTVGVFKVPEYSSLIDQRHEMQINIPMLRSLGLAHLNASLRIQSNLDEEVVAGIPHLNVASLLRFSRAPTTPDAHMLISNPLPLDETAWAIPHLSHFHHIASHRRLAQFLLERAAFLDCIVRDESYWDEWEMAVPQYFQDLPAYDNAYMPPVEEAEMRARYPEIDPLLFLDPAAIMQREVPLADTIPSGVEAGSENDSMDVEEQPPIDLRHARVVKLKIGQDNLRRFMSAATPSTSPPAELRASTRPSRRTVLTRERQVAQEWAHLMQNIEDPYGYGEDIDMPDAYLTKDDSDDEDYVPEH